VEEMTQIPNESTELQIQKTIRYFECVRQGIGTTSALTRNTIYKQFLKANEGKTISKTVFCQSVCRCIKDPGAHACVDLHLSGLYHLMQRKGWISVSVSVNDTPHAKERLDNCECERHKKARDAIELNYTGEDPPVLWEEYFSRSPWEIIRVTCCPARDKPMLCCEVGDKPPRMIPWKCTHNAEDGITKYNECGVQKNIQILDGCPALAELPVLVWELAPRSGKTASGEQRTQIELTQCQWKLNNVVKKLVVQLGICYLGRILSQDDHDLSACVRNIQRA
jgi:hypothetical protein